MPRAKTRVALLTATPGPDPTWSPAANPAMAELLDHLAKELAGEYVRLMEKAAEAEGARDREPEPEEG